MWTLNFWVLRPLQQLGIENLQLSSTVSVHFLPVLFEPEALRGGVAVVIDVLRASTTIVHALAAGASE